MNTLASFSDIGLNTEFPVNEQCQYLNHAAVAPWPESARKAVAQFAQENTQLGSANYMQWLNIEAQLRSNLASLVGASVDSIAFVKNTSEALSFVAYGIDWQPGDVVIISDEEFPSNRIVWESLASKGVIVNAVSLNGETPEQHILDAIAQGARLLSISAIQYASGTRMDLTKLGQACRDNGVLFCVDAIQAIGAVQFDVNKCQCDFAMADGHKWMLGPEGLGLFYVRPEVMNQLSLNEYGWHMIEHMGDYSRKDWEIAKTARRFECGSPNLLAAHALKAGTDLLLNIGMDKVEAAISARVNYLASELTSAGAKLLTPHHSLGRSGIITFDTNGHNPVEIWQTLMKDGVIGMHRGGGIRYSPHCHTPQAALDTAVEKVARLCGW
ncbi:MAG: aminotransferase class V-fold PLP-dependent enzyme [Pseudomonas sp.]|jgi:selenocysteine lyase/cysteine desulfurase|nr:aminotransferase class V-fold PLP-dependent enzyme [Pseudomonas sp.]PHR97305.1 MAG: aminotransferase [Oceanobacter sp.]